MRKHFPESGWSTLSLIIGLTLSAPVVASLVVCLHNAADSAAKAASAAQEAQAVLRTTHMLARVIEDLDTHRFAMPPVVHVAGHIAFTDGSPNPVMRSPAAIRPSPLSDAITGLRLAPAKSLSVNSCRIVGNTASYTACQRYGKRLTSSANEGYIGLGTSGFIEFSGRTSGNGRCRGLRLTPSKSMSVPAVTDLPACSVHILVPIQEHYTTYADSGGNLRYLKHRGNLNAENQPLFKAISSLRLKPYAVLSSSIHAVSISIETGSEKTFEISLMNTLGRTGYFNLLLNP